MAESREPQILGVWPSVIFSQACLKNEPMLESQPLTFLRITTYEKGQEIHARVQAPVQFERTVNRDNTVSFQNLSLQIEALRWRSTLVGCTVIVHQHLDGSISLPHGPHPLGRYNAQGTALEENKMRRGRAVEKPRGGKVQKQTFPQPRLLLAY
jgi:hypothetical protein